MRRKAIQLIGALLGASLYPIGAWIGNFHVPTERGPDMLIFVIETILFTF